MKKINSINIIQDWFSSKCDGYWEHLNGIKIENTDNPGWLITITGVIPDIKLLDIIKIEYGINFWYEKTEVRIFSETFNNCLDAGAVFLTSQISDKKV